MRLEEMGRPGQRPILPYGEGGYERVRHNKAKGASPSWAVLCGFSLVARITLGTIVNAETSGDQIGYDVAGGVVGGLAFCAAAFIKLG